MWNEWYAYVQEWYPSSFVFLPVSLEHEVHQRLYTQGGFGFCVQRQCLLLSLYSVLGLCGATALVRMCRVPRTSGPTLFFPVRLSFPSLPSPTVTKFTVLLVVFPQFLPDLRSQQGPREVSSRTMSGKPQEHNLCASARVVRVQVRERARKCKLEWA